MLIANLSKHREIFKKEYSKVKLSEESLIKDIESPESTIFSTVEPSVGSQTDNSSAIENEKLTKNDKLPQHKVINEQKIKIVP